MDNNETNLITFPHYVRLVKKNIILLGIIFVLSIAGAVVTIMMMETKYEAECTFVVIGEKQPNFMGFQQLKQMIGLDSSFSLNVDYKTLIDSRQITLAVADKVDLFNKLKKEPDQELMDRRDMHMYMNAITVVKDESAMGGTVSIKVKAPEPAELSAEIANTYFEELNEYLNTHQLTAATRNRQFLEGRIEKSKEKLASAELARKEFLEQNRIAFDIDSNVQGKLSIYSRLINDLITAETLRDAAKAEREAILRKNSPNFTVDKAAPEIISDPGVSTIRSKLIEAEIELFNTQQIYKPGNAKVIVRENELNNLKDSLKQEIESVTGSTTTGADIEYIIQSSKADAIKAILAKYERELRDMPGVSTEYLRVIRELETQEEVVKILIAEYEQALIQEARENETIEILDPAVTPKYVASPKRKVILQVTAVLSILFGLFLVFTIDFIKRSYEEERVQQS